MKKTIAVCLIALTVVIPVFATGTVGITTGPSFNWLTVTNGSGDSAVSTKYSQTNWSVAVDGNYFFNDGPWGLAFGLDVSFPISVKSGDTTTDISDGSNPYFATMFAPYVGGTYKGAINRQLSWQAEAGMMIGFGSYTYDGTISATVKQTQISAYADLGVNYDFSKNVAATVGMKALIPFSTSFSSTASIGSISASGDSKQNKTGFGILPYIGVSYLY